MAPFTEHSFSIDDFKTPKVYQDNEAAMVMLTRLLILEPGTIQSHPTAGCGLNSRYKYAVDDGQVTSELQRDYQRQIQTYLPELEGAQVSCDIKDSTLRILVQTNSFIYGFAYDTKTAELKSGYSNLSDL